MKQHSNKPRRDQQGGAPPKRAPRGRTPTIRGVGVPPAAAAPPAKKKPPKKRGGAAIRSVWDELPPLVLSKEELDRGLVAVSRQLHGSPCQCCSCLFARAAGFSIELLIYQAKEAIELLAEVERLREERGA